MDRLRTERLPARAFDITGDWKATALQAETWVDTLTEGGRGFMPAWRKEEVDVVRQRQEKREATRLGKEAVIAHGSIEFCEATPIGLADESKESLYGRETGRDLRSA